MLDCLIIDDEKMLADSTCEYFNMFDIKSKALYSYNEAKDFLDNNDVSLILLDINLGDGSGFELCKYIRENKDIPILFISARKSDDDKIIALNIGGDDYIEKPYSLGVLLAKAKVVLKRFKKSTELTYNDGFLSLDDTNRVVSVDGEPVKLTQIEYKLIRYLIANKNRLVSKTEIFDNVWQDKFTGDGTLNVHIRKIREAIELDPNNPRYIITVWKEGYKFIGK